MLKGAKVVVIENRGFARKKIKNLLRVLLFILPALIPLGVFWIFPMCQAIFMSFTDWDYMSSAYNIVGFDNYKSIFSDSMFYDALKNTVIFTLGTLVPTIVGGLFTACRCIPISHVPFLRLSFASLIKLASLAIS